MTLNQHIDELIAQRQSRLPLLIRVIREAEEFMGLLAALTNNVDSNATHIPTDLRMEAEQLTSQVTKASQRLKSLHERFSRPCLTIVSFGKARQGKSRQLQSITGLTDKVVPTGDKGHCTAALIDVRHSPESSHAKITTYSEADFLSDRVAPFFDDLGVPEKCPTSLEVFAKMVFPRIEQFLGTKKTSVTQVMAGRYEMLQILQAALPSVVPHLNGKETEKNLDELRSWISYPEIPSGEERLTVLRKHGRCFAVRRATIFVPMPLSDCKNIRVVDTPGVDGFSSADFASAASILSHEADAALVTFLPRGTGQVWEKSDSALLDDLSEKMEDPVTLSSFTTIVLNELRTGDKSNRPQAEYVQAEAKQLGVGQFEIKIADCSDRESLHHVVLIPLLKRLVQEGQHLDFVRIKQPLESLQASQIKFQSILRQVNAVFAVEADRLNPDARFREEFERAKRKMTGGLRKLRLQATLAKETEDKAFLADLEKVAKSAAESVSIPTSEDVERAVLELPEGENGTVFENFMLRLRSDLASKFDRLRHELGTAMIDSWRRNLWSCLAPMHIDRIVDAKNANDALSELSSKCDAIQVAPRLGESFRMLADFKIHFPHFLASVWDALDFNPTDELPDLFESEVETKRPAGRPQSANRTLQPPAADTTGIRSDLCAKTSEILAKRKGELIAKISEELKGLAKLPAKLSWAMICDMYDRLVVTDGIWRQWEALLRQHQQQFLDGANNGDDHVRDHLLGVKRQSENCLRKLSDLRFEAT